MIIWLNKIVCNESWTWDKKIQDRQQNSLNRSHLRSNKNFRKTISIFWIMDTSDQKLAIQPQPDYYLTSKTLAKQQKLENQSFFEPILEIQHINWKWVDIPLIRLFDIQCVAFSPYRNPPYTKYKVILQNPPTLRNWKSTSYLVNHISVPYNQICIRTQFTKSTSDIHFQSHFQDPEISIIIKTRRPTSV